MTAEGPDPVRVGELLLAVEASVHRDGWDEPARLYVLTQAGALVRSGISFHTPVHAGGLTALSIAPPMAFHGNPAHALFKVAWAASQGLPAAGLFVALIGSVPGFVGLAFVVESWMRRDMSDAERDALGERSFADIPGSLEARMVHARDCADRMYAVSRPRGEQPRLSLPGDGHPEGSIVESLAVLVAAATGRPLPELTGVPRGWDVAVRGGS